MGRHGGREHGKERSETKEERLLRKAREYVDGMEQKKNEHDDKKSRRAPSHRDKEKHDRDEDEERRRHRHEKNDSRKKHRRDSKERDESDDSRHRKRKHDRESEHSRTHRKRRHEDDERDRKDKRHKKEKHHKKKEKEKRKDKPARVKVDKASLCWLGEKFGKVPPRTLDVEQDYFAYHQHLWVYLYREEGVFFGDLTSDDARKAFQRFAGRYNAGELEAAYYDPKGLPLEAIEASKTTGHAWSFKTNQTELDSLHILQEGVRKQTEYHASAETSVSKAKQSDGNAVFTSGVDRVQEMAANKRRGKTPEERLSERVAGRRLRGHITTAEEEFAGGKKDGRERQIEKRKEKAAAIHGAARDKEEAGMGGVELSDDAIFGGSGDFQQALSRERQRKAQREKQRNARVAELQQKEQDKQKAMLEMIGIAGLKPGEKITIAPRNDTK